MADQRAKRKLTVTSCEAKYHGTNAKGEYTIYEVFAVDEAGTPVEQKLNSFSELAVGELVEYEVTVRESEKYGRTFTLWPPRSRRASSGLAKSLDALRERVDDLERKVDELMSRAGPPPSTQSQSQGSPAAAEEEIPF